MWVGGIQSCTKALKRPRSSSKDAGRDTASLFTKRAGYKTALTCEDCIEHEDALLVKSLLFSIGTVGEAKTSSIILRGS